MVSSSPTLRSHAKNAGSGVTVDEIVSAARDVANTYHRLVLLVAPIAGGKSASLASAAGTQGWPLLNVNEVVAAGLLELDSRERVIECKRVLADAISATGADTVVLDNVEILFEKPLQQNPMSLFESLSRTTTLIVSWPGIYDGQSLMFADPTHRDYRKYSNPTVRILTKQHE